jgi:hypothetical protein
MISTSRNAITPTAALARKAYFAEPGCCSGLLILALPLQAAKQNISVSLSATKNTQEF